MKSVLGGKIAGISYCNGIVENIGTASREQTRNIRKRVRISASKFLIANVPLIFSHQTPGL